MFHEESLINVGIRLQLGEKEEIMHTNLDIDPSGQINLNQLIVQIRQTYHLDSQLLFFYLDHSRATFEFVDQEDLVKVHFTSLISENFVTLKLQHRLSDEILANPLKLEEEGRSKRSRERIIQEAFYLIEQWRFFYREGSINEQGQKTKLNLERSAEIVGVPRKTLQDYYLLFRTGKTLEFDFYKKHKEKIGVLRAFVKEKGKSQRVDKKIDEKKFFRELRFQILGEKIQEELFDILQSNKSHYSSDEDMIFQD